jgi:hypothetical protein
VSEECPPGLVAAVRKAHDEEKAAMAAKFPYTKVLFEGLVFQPDEAQTMLFVACDCTNPDCTGFIIQVRDVRRGLARFFPSREQLLELSDALRKAAAQ